jgi:uncharacterized DUF497 family protein
MWYDEVMKAVKTSVMILSAFEMKRRWLIVKRLHDIENVKVAIKMSINQIEISVVSARNASVYCQERR